MPACSVKKGTVSPIKEAAGGILAPVRNSDLAEGAEPFIYIFLGWWVLSVDGKSCDGICRRMAEHKAHVWLKTSVKSRSGQRGKRRRKTKNREELSFRILDPLDPRCLQDLHHCRCSLPFARLA